jgi:hypothetical protein
VIGVEKLGKINYKFVFKIKSEFDWDKSQLLFEN